MFLNQKKGYYEQVEIESGFDVNFIAYVFNGDKDKTLLLDEYLEIIKTYLKNVISSLKESGEWKTQLLKYIDENSHKYLWGDNKEIITIEDTDGIIKALFKKMTSF